MSAGRYDDTVLSFCRQRKVPMVVASCVLAARGRGWGEQGGDGLVEESFEQSRGGGPQGVGLPSADQPLQMAQAERAGFAVLAGEDLRVLDELLEGQASFPDALCEQGARRSIGHISSSGCGEVVIVAFVWRACPTAAEYDKVNVVVTDTDGGAPVYAPDDRVIATVSAGDIPPAWTDQLIEGGRIIVPLRMRGLARSAVSSVTAMPIVCVAPMRRHIHPEPPRVDLTGP
ncbi:MAG: hypothetical protein ACRDQ4_06140 [Pseudonocardiaceae bacterium]